MFVNRLSTVLHNVDSVPGAAFNGAVVCVDFTYLCALNASWDTSHKLVEIPIRPTKRMRPKEIINVGPLHITDKSR